MSSILLYSAPMINTLSRMSVTTRLLVNAGLRRGLTITLLPPSRNTFLVRIGDREHIWKETAFGNPVSISRICKQKQLTHALLKFLGYAVPEAKVFTASEKIGAMEWIVNNPNVVLKPLDAAHGDDITVLPKGPDEINEAWDLVLDGKQPRKRVLLEEYVGGEDYRLLVVGNMCLYVMHRIPATIVGDGMLTIQQLVDRENKRPSRGAVRYGSFYSPIVFDRLLEQTLTREEKTLDSVPLAGERVVLTRVCNVGCGGTEFDMTPYVTQSLMDDAVTLTTRLGMDILAIDVRCEDIRTVTSLKDIKILELNSTPGITLGTAGWIADAVWDALLSKYDPYTEYDTNSLDSSKLLSAQ